MKHIIFIFFIAILLSFSLAQSTSADTPFPDANKESALALQAQPFDSGASRIDVLELPGYEEEPFVLFLPAGCDRNRLRVSFSADSLSVDGVSLRSGEPTDVFVKDGIYTVTTPQGTYPLRVLSSENIPSLFIETESGTLDTIHADKSYKEPGKLTIAENGAITLNGAALEYIKGRGNSSWRSNEKRSYTIKLEEPEGLLGMAPAKKWVLTSNNMDVTLMRNAIAYSAAQLTNLPYTVDFAFVDLYVNGDYRGNYLLCEKIEVGENRIAIADLEEANETANPGLVLSETKKEQNSKTNPTRAWCDIPNEPNNISGGYLLEYEYPDAFTDEKSAFITETGTCLLLHSPKHATKGEINYIAELYGKLEAALLAEDGRNKEGKHYSEYLDMDSFIDGLLLYDFTANQDGGFTSWYIYLPENQQKFYMGPMWDFDQSMENASLVPDSITFSARALYDKEHRSGERRQRSFIELLFSHRDFTDLVTERFAALADTFTGPLTKTIDALFAAIDRSAEMDRVRWGYTVDQRKDVQLIDFITDRIEQLQQEYSHLDARINEVYEETEANGGYRTRRNHDQKPWLIIVICVLAISSLTVLLAVVRKSEKHKKQNAYP